MRCAAGCRGWSRQRQRVSKLAIARGRQLQRNRERQAVLCWREQRANLQRSGTRRGRVTARRLHMCVSQLTLWLLWTAAKCAASRGHGEGAHQRAAAVSMSPATWQLRAPRPQRGLCWCSCRGGWGSHRPLGFLLRQIRRQLQVLPSGRRAGPPAPRHAHVSGGGLARPTSKRSSATGGKPQWQRVHAPDPAPAGAT